MTRVLIPDAVMPTDKYVVCYTNKYFEEVILQSEQTSVRAEYSVEVLNTQERDNARREKFFWRKAFAGEIA
jgi:hypothetical protein